MDYLNGPQKHTYNPRGPRRIKRNAYSNLSDVEKKLYDQIATHISAIADGNESSTSFTINTDDIKTTDDFFTFKYTGDLNDTNASDKAYQNWKNTNANKFDCLRVMNTLMVDAPYELYWFNKSIGWETTSKMERQASTGNNEITVKITQYTIKLSCSEEFANKNGSSAQEKDIKGNSVTAYYEADITKTKAASSVKAKVEEIVKNHASEDDYTKLKSYEKEICDLTEYNSAAAKEDYSGSDISPWQLIYVFDDDPATNVVCEGYSKAFQYLVERSSFNSDKIKSYIISGYIPGGHMWNIVTMDDGNNYLVDVTNSDSGNIGEDGDSLFLAGTSGNIEDGYTFTIDTSNNIHYRYNDETKSLYGTGADSILNLAPAHYVYTKKYTVSAPTGVTFKDGTKKFDSDAKVTFTVPYKDGNDCTVTASDSDGSSVTLTEGTKTADNVSYSFTMPEKNVMINVTYSPKEYKVTAAEGSFIGSAGTTEKNIKFGDTVSVTAPEKTGYTFSKFSLSQDVTGASTTGNTITFKMPAGNVTVTPVYTENKYSVSVTGGTLSTAKAGTYSDTLSDISSTKAQTVYLKPEEADGKKLVSWKCSDSDVTINTSSETATATIAAGHTGKIDITAEYKYLITKSAATNGTFTVTGCDADGYAAKGNEITAKAVPNANYDFDTWTVSGVTLSDAKTGTVSFTMPEGPVTIGASFKEKQKYSLTVSDGTITPEDAKNGIYAGTSVTVALDETKIPADHKFSKWSVTGLTETIDVTKTSLTFVMPANDVEITPVYEEIKKEGPTPTPEPTPDPEPGKEEPTPTPEPTPDPEPGKGSTDTPAPEPGEGNTDTPSPEPGKGNTDTPSPEPGKGSTDTPSSEPGKGSTDTPAPEPGEGNTDTPSSEPGKGSTDTPAPAPSEEEPTPTPEPTPSTPETNPTVVPTQPEIPTPTTVTPTETPTVTVPDITPTVTMPDITPTVTAPEPTPGTQETPAVTSPDTTTSEPAASDNESTSDDTSATPVAQEPAVPKIPDLNNEITAAIDETTNIYHTADGNIADSVAILTINGVVITDSTGKALPKNTIAETKNGNVLIANDGYLASSEIVKITVNKKVVKYVADKDGYVAHDEIVELSNGKKVYADRNGVLVVSKIITVAKKSYYTKKSGAIATNGFYKVTKSKTVYAAKSGVLKKNTVFTVKGKKYVAGKNCVIKKNGWITKGKIKYYCNKNGVVTKTKKIK